MSSQYSSVITHPCISYWGIHKSARFLDAITSYYFPLYGLSNKDFFTYYPVLGFVEALIYQVDEALEASQVKKSLSDGIRFWNKTKVLIINLLKECNLEHPLIEKQLENIGEYCELENKLMSQKVVTYADVIKSAELRSSDVRTLHTILFQAANKPYKESTFDTMWALEVLADIQEDIEQYQDDVKKDKFNIYRMFVKLYGEKAPEYLKAERERYKNIFRERLAQLPEDEQKIYLGLVSKYKKEVSVKAIPEPILE